MNIGNINCVDICSLIKKENRKEIVLGEVNVFCEVFMSKILWVECVLRC